MGYGTQDIMKTYVHRTGWVRCKRDGVMACVHRIGWGQSFKWWVRTGYRTGGESKGTQNEWEQGYTGGVIGTQDGQRYTLMGVKAKVNNSEYSICETKGYIDKVGSCIVCSMPQAHTLHHHSR